MRFSQRIGKSPIKSLLQTDVMDEDLQNGLWNTIYDDFFLRLDHYSSGRVESGQMTLMCRLLWKDFFKQRIDHYTNVQTFIDWLENWYFQEADYYELYDLIEVLASYSKQVRVDFIDKCNKVLTRELSAYRIVGEQLAPITSEEEISSIDEAIQSTNKWKSVNEHLKVALELLADKQNPNYRNSIKESISAVESLCKILTGNNKATLGKALAELEKKHSLHSSFKEALHKLYGYTSDSSGIRHSLIETDGEVEFADAKFMLVSCSAFINYLKSKVD